MIKKEILQKIKSVIERVGYTTAGELELDYSPIYKSIGENIIALVEGFGSETFDIVVYHNDIEIDNFRIEYDEIMDTLCNVDLEDILESLERYSEN